MRTEELISALVYKMKNGAVEIREQLPLGVKEDGGVLFSHEKASDKVYGVNHTCITGTGATAYIKRLIALLSALYKKGEAQFLILSPKTEYAELLRLENADITLPYIRSMQDISVVKQVYIELLQANERQKKAPKLFLILDGLETLDNAETGDLNIYRSFLELSIKKSVEVITGANLIKSIFSGFPGAFVGVGNCLLTTDGKSQADATFVAPDSSMSLPVAITIPIEPSVAETVLFLNAFRTQD